MRKVTNDVLMLLALTCFALPAAVHAQSNAPSTKLSWNGQARIRQETTDVQSYAAPGTIHGMDQTLLRLRLWLEADTGKDVKAFFHATLEF